METAESFHNPLVILNPTANRGHMAHYRSLLQERLARETGEYVETTRQGEARERAMQAALEGRPVIIVGGDGSMHEAANGILASGRRVPLGIVAAGSGNDFAWNTLKLPHDPAAAIERAFAGQIVAADAGKMNDCYFVNSFSIGLDADIAVAAGALKKYPLMSGERLYYSATLRQLLFGYHRCPWLSFQLDGANPQAETQKRYVLMAITNGPTYGAGFRINPKAAYSDGLFDVCTINYTPLMRALRLLPIVQRGEHEALPEVTFYRTRHVIVESRFSVNIQMDGETQSAARFEATILPSALLVRI